MNPLMGPRLENTTVAWIAYKLVSTLSFLIVSALNYCYNIILSLSGQSFREYFFINNHINLVFMENYYYYFFRSKWVTYLHKLLALH